METKARADSPRFIYIDSELVNTYELINMYDIVIFCKLTFRKSKCIYLEGIGV